MIAKKKAQENKMELADQTKFDPKMSHECEEVEDAEQRAINESKAEHDKIVNLEKTFAYCFIEEKYVYKLTNNIPTYG